MALSCSGFDKIRRKLIYEQTQNMTDFDMKEFVSRLKNVRFVIKTYRLAYLFRRCTGSVLLWMLELFWCTFVLYLQSHLYII